MNNKKGFSSLILKIIGIITMTLDHFGRMDKVFFVNQTMMVFQIFLLLLVEFLSPSLLF